MTPASFSAPDISGSAHSLRGPLPISVPRAALTDSGGPSDDPAAIFSFPSLPSGLGQPSLTLQAPGQIRSHLRDLGPAYLIDVLEEGAFPGSHLWPVCALGHCLPEVLGKTDTYMTAGLEHMLLVSK